MTKENWLKLVASFELTISMNRADGTLKLYLVTMDRFTRWLDAHAKDYSFSMENIHGFFVDVLSQGKSASTIIFHQIAMTAMGRFLFNQKVIPMNPFDEYSPRRHLTSRNRGVQKKPPYTVEEIKQMRATVATKRFFKAPRNAKIFDSLIVIGWETGLRVSDMLKIRWEHIDWGRRVLHVRPCKTKHTGKSVDLPLNDSAISAFDYWRLNPRDDGFVFPSENVFMRASCFGMHHCKPPWRGFHCLRRGFITRLGSNGVSTMMISKYTTQSLATVEGYFEPSLETMRAVLEANATDITPYKIT